MHTLSEWLARQETAHVASIDLTLERVASVARRLGLDRPAWPSIIVGGTNGKGSTVAHLESLLLALGRRVGTFTSPHLRRYNERIHVAGREAGDAELIDAFERIEAARAGTTLTFFEYNTLAALEVFRRRQVDCGVLEVGLGGRLDATNLVDANVAVICSVGLDHTDWLGTDLESIGREKAGICRPGRPVVLGTAQMPASVFAAIERVGAVPWVQGEDFRFTLAGGLWRYAGRTLELRDLPPSRLAGEIQYANAASALAALEALGLGAEISHDIAARALERVALQGRFQIVPGPVEWILDVAHNEPAARCLAAQLAQRPCAGRTLAVAGILRDKDAAGIAAALAPVIDAWVPCTLEGARGEPAAALRERLTGAREVIALAPDVAAGCAIAREQARPGDRIVVFGSFYTVGPALDWLSL
jgi:dihydrofolate synthase/folylpolyglutamate synthase